MTALNVPRTNLGLDFERIGERGIGQEAFIRERFEEPHDTECGAASIQMTLGTRTSL
ncbi:MAG TPA: hypothetical protein VIW29_02745 [Polyangiaceae bacterium]